MSKAIYGHLGGSDALLVTEIARLRRRVAELEAQVAGHEAELVSVRDTDLDVALRELGEQQVALT